MINCKYTLALINEQLFVVKHINKFVTKIITKREEEEKMNSEEQQNSWNPGV